MKKTVNPIVLHITKEDAWRLHNKGMRVIQYESPTSYKYQEIPKDVGFPFFQQEEKSYALVLPEEDSAAIHSSFKWLPLWGILFSILLSIGLSFLSLTKIPNLKENASAFYFIGVGFSSLGAYCVMKIVIGIIGGEKVRAEVLRKYNLID